MAFFGRRKASAGNQSQRSVCSAHPLGEPARRYVHSLTGRERRSCFSAAASVGPERSPLGTRTPVSLDCFGAKLRFASRPRLFEKRRPKNFLSGSAAECLRCLFAPRLCRTMSRVRAAGFAGAFPPGHGLIGLSRSSPARRGTSCAAPPASPGARPPQHGGRSGGTRRR